MLWNDINPVLKAWFIKIELHNFLQLCIVISLEIELLSKIVNVVVFGDPLVDDWLHCEALVQGLVVWVGQVGVVHKDLAVIAFVDSNKEIVAIVGHVRVDHGIRFLWEVKEKRILLLLLANSVIVNLHVLQLVRLLPLLATHIGFLVLVQVALRDLVLTVEEAFVVAVPRGTAEFNPHQLVVLEVLSRRGIFNVYCFPVRAALLLGVGHVLAVVTPVGRTHLRFSVLIERVWVHKELCILQRVHVVDVVGALLLDSIPLGLGHEATVVAEKVVITVLIRDSDFWEVPILRNCLLKFLSILTLFEESVR